MDCQCGRPIRMYMRDKKMMYYCPIGRCKIYASGPVECSGYKRLIANPKDPEGTLYIRFEALLNPLLKQTAASGGGSSSSNDNSGGTQGAETAADYRRLLSVMAVVQGDLGRRTDAQSVLQNEELFEAAWYVPKEAYLYPLSAYAALTQSLRRLPNVRVQEIPQFFFNCAERFAKLATPEDKPDETDSVFCQLRGFQQAGVRFVLSRGGRAMIADDMGLGKTVQAIAVAHHYRAEWPVLVVCPMSLMENWAREFNRFCSVPFSRIGVLHGNSATFSAEHSVVIVCYSSLSCLDRSSFAVVILDESHFIKSMETKRTKQALRLCAGARRVLLLSGTPVSRPIDLFSQLLAMAPSVLDTASGGALTKTQYGARYCNSFFAPFNRGVNLSGHSHEEELHFLLRYFVIRRAKEDVLSEIPSKSRQLLYVHITDKEKKAMEQHVTALRTSVNRSSSAPGPTALSSGLDLKEATARAKIPAVEDYVSQLIEQRLETREKTIIFAHYGCMIEALENTVKKVRPPLDYILITGRTQQAQRDQLVQHFQTSATCFIAILTMQTCGTGLNLTCADTVIFAELDWVPSTHLQCEDRVHRLGQHKPCFIKYLLAEGTADTVIWPLLQTKLSVAAAVLENNEMDDVDANRDLNKAGKAQKVARRDIAGVACTQGTLDGFVRSRSTTTARPSQSEPASTESADGDALAAPRRKTVLSIAEMLAQQPPQQLLSTPGGKTNGNKPMPGKSSPVAAAAAVPPRMSSSSTTLSVIDMMKTPRITPEKNTDNHNNRNVNHNVSGGGDAVTMVVEKEKEKRPTPQPMFSIDAVLGRPALEALKARRTTFVVGNGASAVPNTTTPSTATSAASPPPQQKQQCLEAHDGTPIQRRTASLADSPSSPSPRDSAGSASGQGRPSVVARIQVPVRIGLKRSFGATEMESAGPPVSTTTAPTTRTSVTPSAGDSASAVQPAWQRPATISIAALLATSSPAITAAAPVPSVTAATTSNATAAPVAAPSPSAPASHVLFNADEAMRTGAPSRRTFLTWSSTGS